MEQSLRAVPVPRSCRLSAPGRSSRAGGHYLNAHSVETRVARMTIYNWITFSAQHCELTASGRFHWCRPR